ncbi:protein of unknown function DUF4283 - like 10 [Theobroma cacao]|nr:protein of unknown function DUF4283 - like 10 [Theobroma cacao]
MSLVGKFSRMPRLQEIRSAFKGIGLAGAYEIRWLDYKHVLIHLFDEQDFNRIWTKQNWFIANQKIRVFKWSPEFEPEQESAVVPVWISFPNLKAHLFKKSALLLVAKTVKRPLFIDEATANGSRTSVARVCVEYDCRKPPLEQIWIIVQNRETGAVTSGYSQKLNVLFLAINPRCWDRVSHWLRDDKEPPTRASDGRRIPGQAESRGKGIEGHVENKGNDVEQRKNMENKKILSSEETAKQLQHWQGPQGKGNDPARDPKSANDANSSGIKEPTGRDGDQKSTSIVEHASRDKDGELNSLHREEMEERRKSADDRNSNSKMGAAAFLAILQTVEDDVQPHFHVCGMHGQAGKEVGECAKHAELKRGSTDRYKNNKNKINIQQKLTEGVTEASLHETVIKCLENLQDEPEGAMIGAAMGAFFPANE